MAGSQNELARRLGLTSGTVTGWMKNGRIPHISSLDQLRSAFDIRPEWLLSGDEPMRAMSTEDEPSEYLAGGSPRELITHALQRKGMTIAQLGKSIGYDAGALRYVIEGRGRLKEKDAEKIARVLGLPTEQLMDGSDDAKIVSETGTEGTFGAKPDIKLPPGMSGRYVPLLSMAQAGSFDASHTDDYYDFTGVLAINVDDRRAFAIRVSGKSMEPVILEGDVIICSPSKEAKPGKVAVVRTHSDQAFVKYWHPEGDKVRLVSANKDFPPIVMPASEIAGVWPVVQRTTAEL